MIAPSVTPEFAHRQARRLTEWARRQRRQHRRGVRDLVQRCLWRVGART